MKNLYRLIACLFILNLIISCTLSAQTATINSVDPSGYPWLKAYYTIKDASDNEVRVNTAADVIIKENGDVKTHKPDESPYCPPPTQKTFSVCCVIDASASMFGQGIDGTPNSSPDKMQIVLDALRNFIDALDPNRTEVSIIEFGTQARIVYGWSNNKDSLHKALDINNIVDMQYTDYNSAFLGYKDPIRGFPYVDSSQSALHVVQFAKYKRVIVFLTDGKFNATSDCIGKDPFTGTPVFLLSDVINQARRQLTRVFVIHIGTEALDSISATYLQGLAGIEGNPSDNIRTGITSANELGNYYQHIADICGQVGYSAPCEVTWQSQCTPTGSRTLELDFPNYWNLTASTSFTIPDNDLSKLDIRDKEITFWSKLIYDTTITIRALNNDVEITGSISTDSNRYYIKDWGAKGNPPFILSKNDSTTITISFNWQDSVGKQATITILGSACSGNELKVSNKELLSKDDLNNNSLNIANYPNPFTQITSIAYTLDKQVNVELSIYDLFGNKVKVLLDEAQDSGTYKIDWDGINSKGEKVSSGTYFYQIKTDGKILTKQMLIIR